MTYLLTYSLAIRSIFWRELLICNYLSITAADNSVVCKNMSQLIAIINIHCRWSAVDVSFCLAAISTLYNEQWPQRHTPETTSAFSL